ncbi:MAG: phospho-N-acetylmuramoyl-pentapeptide-transferase [Ndongobacter sp.]|nr:phospho-N-acetylmuramoyl-pentapeptide-transferase [Ndongobacter sp.]
MINPAQLVLLACALSAAATYFLIGYLREHHIGQPIRKEGNQEHLKKQGTPTMGGLAFIPVALILTLIVNGFHYASILLLIGTVGFGAIGFLDDYEKVRKAQNEGLTPRQKLILQAALAVVMVCIVYFADPSTAVQRIPLFNWKWNLGFLWIPLLAFVVVGTVNAVNLTDGLDGLLTGVTIPVFLTIGLISVTHVLSGTPVFQSAMIFAGALAGYLFFNANPASIMMGDTGSMAIGGAITAMMLSLNVSLFLVILGGVYVMEALSVIIQVAYFRKTGGKRIFLMSPIHHHFELKGFAEQKVTAAFSLVSMILCLITLSII